jgi:hypothetical protein
MLGGIYSFNVDSLVAIFSVLRIYHFVRVYVHYSVWFTGETQLICKKFGFIPDLYFVIKTELKVRPFKVLLSAMFLIAMVAALIIQSCETPFTTNDKTQDFGYFINPLWMCFVTMATVGYGDFYPRTHLGRLTGVAVSIMGMISASLFVVFLQQLVEFNPKEQKVVNSHTHLYSITQNASVKRR